MDKVRFEAQERLDLVDANALQSLVYEYISEALGGLMGNSGGALTALEYGTNESGGVYTLELKAFQYYHCQPGGTVSVTEPDGTTRSVPRKYTGQVVSFDPTDSGQVATVDWSSIRQTWVTNAQPSDQTGLNAKQAIHGGHKPGGSLLMPFLWARPYTVDTDTDSRRQWSVSSQAEVAVSISTRTRVRTEFKFQSGRPAVSGSDTNQNQWVAIGRCVAWDYTSGTTNSNGANVPDAPYIVPIYVWDHSFSYGDYEQTNGLEGAGTKGKIGHGTARFAMDDGAIGAGQHPSGNLQAANDIESTPFEGDGATISVFGRGKWLPGSKTGEPTITGGASDIVGASAAGADPWPYPGWYDDKASEWKSLDDSGWRTDVPLWRMGIPHVMHMMRRQMAAIMSSNGDRPWYAWPEGGGLRELKDELDTLRTYVDTEIAALNYVENKTGQASSLLASARIQTPASGASGGTLPTLLAGAGITFIEYATTPAASTTAPYSSNGATAIVCECSGVDAATIIGSVQVQCEAFGSVSTDDHPAAASAGDPTKPQGLRFALPMAWVTLGDLAKENTGSRFTIWIRSSVLIEASQSTSAVDLDLGIDVDHPAASSTGISFALYPAGSPPSFLDATSGTVTNVTGQFAVNSGASSIDYSVFALRSYKLGVDFSKQWASYGGLAMQITVHGMPSGGE